MFQKNSLADTDKKKQIYRFLAAFAVVSALVLGARHYYTAAQFEKKVIRSYAEGAYLSYRNALDEALILKKSIDSLLEQPSDESLLAARESWIRAHNTYALTEAFRFYGGPIDYSNPEKGIREPEPRLNAWPLNEAYIDYVDENADAGIISGEQPITKALLVEKNQSDDESNVAMGFHAIEFLLWGQDLSLEGPGTRPASDYYPGNGRNERRREYLRIVVDLLIEDLGYLVDAWKPAAGENYANAFLAEEPSESLRKMLTGIATLSGFELASERMATSLDSGDQEDEQSCFSDNTKDSFVYNFRGIKNVYFGSYAESQGNGGLHALLEKKDSKLASQLAAKISDTERLIDAIPHPVDREVLASMSGSPGRYKMELAIRSLQELSDLLKKAGGALGVNVEVVSE